MNFCIVLAKISWLLDSIVFVFFVFEFLLFGMRLRFRPPLELLSLELSSSTSLACRLPFFLLETNMLEESELESESESELLESLSSSEWACLLDLCLRLTLDPFISNFLSGGSVSPISSKNSSISQSVLVSLKTFLKAVLLTISSKPLVKEYSVYLLDGIEANPRI